MSTTELALPSWRAASAVVGVLLLSFSSGGSTAAPASSGTVGAQSVASPDGVDGSDGGEGAPNGGDESSAAEGGATDDEPGPGDVDAEVPDVPGRGATTSTTLDAPAELPDEVDLHEPMLVVRASQGTLSRDDADVEGAGYAAAVGELTATFESDDGTEHDLELLSVDPVGFRPLTPDVTAQAPEVWKRLDEGDVLVRHDVAHELGLELGEQVELRGEGGSTTVRIGALAANGAPPLADVVVPFEVAASLGRPGINAVVVATDTEPEPVAEELRGVGEVEVLHKPEPERAEARPSGAPVELEPFTYTSRGDGTIAIHGDWVQRNIVTLEIPRMGTARCHHVMIPQLRAALQEIIDEGLYDHFKPHQFGGCFVPRHMMWDPDRGLSMHSWGLAIDFNVQDNWYGEPPQMDRRIVEIFERWGFAWGGHWSVPDGMHFELERIVEVD